MVAGAIAHASSCSFSRLDFSAGEHALELRRRLCARSIGAQTALAPAERRALRDTHVSLETRRRAHETKTPITSPTIARMVRNRIEL